MLNIFRRTYFAHFLSRPLILDSRCPEGPHISAGRMFSKNITYDYSSALNGDFARKNDASSQKRQCPNQKNAKSAVFAQLGLFFSKNVGSPPLFGRGVISLPEPLRSTRNYNRRWAFLKKCPPGQDMVAFLRAFRDKISKKCQILANGIIQRGHKLPVKISTSTRLEKECRS